MTVFTNESLMSESQADDDDDDRCGVAAKTGVFAHHISSFRFACGGASKHNLKIKELPHLNTHTQSQ